MVSFMGEKELRYRTGDQNKITNVLFVGVGGQGTIVASKILGEVVLKAGFDVKKSEVHGMAQRGGSVVSQVRFGTKVFSPLVKKGECDFMVSFEQLETLRYLDYLHPRSMLFLTTQKLLPPSVSMGLESYPENIPERLKKSFQNTIVVEGLELAKQAGNVRALNVVLLGVLSRYLTIDEKTWIKTIHEVFPPPLQEVNRKGFYLGREHKPAI
ncbi:MAG: indolepyruvate oxidoreductase subunit beta [Pseudomonadota bacterium]